MAQMAEMAAMADPAQAAPAAVTHRRVLNIALPILLSNATVPILGAVDTGVVGQLGLAAPIGAVGIGAVILSASYWLFGFLRMGTTGLVAQARGAGDATETRAVLLRALLIGLVAGLAFVLFQNLLFRAAFRLSPAPPEVEALARRYLRIRIWGAPAAISIYAVTGWLVATERTRGVFALQLWMNGLNIGLDMWFVLGLGRGVAGVATATLLAEWSGLALGLWLCRSSLRPALWPAWKHIADMGRIRRTMAVNGDLVVRSLAIQAVFLGLLFVAARFGEVTLAADQVILQFLYIMAYALDGFAYAAEALVGEAFGGADRGALRRAVTLAGLWGAAMALPMTALFWFGGGWLIDLMAKAPEVQAAARDYLPWAVVAALAGFPAWMLDGIFIGATRTRDMRNSMVAAGLACLLAMLALIPFWQNHGLWLAVVVFNVARAVTLGLRYPALEAAAEN